MSLTLAARYPLGAPLYFHVRMTLVALCWGRPLQPRPLLLTALAPSSTAVTFHVRTVLKFAALYPGECTLSAPLDCPGSFRNIMFPMGTAL